METKISVVIPFFNNEDTVLRTISSVLQQTSEDWELILVNDGSTDHSERVIQEKLENPKITYYYQENAGVSSARNFGASFVKGEWLIFLDADDELYPNTIQHYTNAIQRHPESKIFIGGITKINNEEMYTKLPEEGHYFAKIPGTFCLSTSLFRRVDGYDSRLKFSENTELFHRISLLGYSEVIIPESMVRYYDNPHGGSKNSKNLIESLEIILHKHENTLTRHGKHLFHQILGVNQMRYRSFPEARKHLLKAYAYKPFKLSTFGRLLIAFIPPVANKFYADKSR